MHKSLQSDVVVDAPKHAVQLSSLMGRTIAQSCLVLTTNCKQ